MTIKKIRQRIAYVRLTPSIKLGELGQHSISKNGKTVYLSNKNICEHYDEFKNTFKY